MARTSNFERKVRRRIKEKIILFIGVIRYLHPLYAVSGIDCYKKDVTKCVRSTGIQAKRYFVEYSIFNEEERYKYVSSILCLNLIKINPFNLEREDNIRFALVILCMSLFDVVEKEIRSDRLINFMRSSPKYFNENHENNGAERKSNIKTSVAIKTSVKFVKSLMYYNSISDEYISLRGMIAIRDLLIPYVRREITRLTGY